MSLMCFKCLQTTANDINQLIRHLRYFHGIHDGDKIICIQNNCQQTFNHMDRFKRHVQTMHDQKNYQNPQICSNLKITSNNKIFESQIEAVQKPNIPKIDIEPENKNVKEENEILKNEIYKMKSEIQRNCLSFMTLLQAESALSIKLFHLIINEITEKITKPISSVIKFFIQPDLPKDKEIALDDIINYVSDPFKLIKSDHLLLKHLENNEIYKRPEKITIDRSIKEHIENHKLVLKKVENEIVLMPIKFQIQKLFESKDLLKRTINNEKEMMSQQKYYNFVQGDLWKQKRSSFVDTDNVIPFFIYYDDFEVNDPLGSHTGNQTIGAFYYTHFQQ